MLLYSWSRERGRQGSPYWPTWIPGTLVSCRRGARGAARRGRRRGCSRRVGRSAYRDSMSACRVIVRLVRRVCIYLKSGLRGLPLELCH